MVEYKTLTLAVWVQFPVGPVATEYPDGVKSEIPIRPSVAYMNRTYPREVFIK